MSMSVHSDRLQAEYDARERCKQFPERVFVAIWNLQIYQWIIVTPEQAKLMFDNGFAMASQIDCYHKGYLIELSDALKISHSKG